MKNLTSDQFDNVAKSSSIIEAFWRRAQQAPNSCLFRYALAPSPSGTRVWREETYYSATPKITRLARYLASQGVSVGTPVAILSQTRPEWLLADLAIQSLGGITVSLYQSLPAPEVGFILHDSKAEVIFVENDEQAQKIHWLQHNTCVIPPREDIEESKAQVTIRTVISFEALNSPVTHKLFHELTADENLPAEPLPSPTSLNRDSVASYVYTSGTTGPPKGVIQTHGNHLSNVYQAGVSGVFALDGSLFLYLPLAHSFARLIYHVGVLTSAYIVLPAVADHKSSKMDLSSVAKDIQEGSASVLPSVPRLFEKMAAAIKTQAAGKTLKQKLVGLCITNALGTYERRTLGKPLSMIERILFDGLTPVRAKIKKQLFGAKFRHGISGGAKLDAGVCRFFDALEITICEGYGLTETCVATHVNLPNKRRIGSVGPAFIDIQVRVSPEDGEISLRGPNVTRDYLNRPQATREAWDTDGWFHTGDVGRVDDQGFLYITDRKKELVITAGGKKIPPATIEGMFKRFPFVSQAFLYGEGKPFCVMLFTMNEADLRTLLQSQHITLSPDLSLSEAPVVISLFQEAVSEVNRELASFERIKRFKILAHDFTIESGLITPTLKMKRKVIVAQYRDEIEGLYEGT